MSTGAKELYQALERIKAARRAIDEGSESIWDGACELVMHSSLTVDHAIYRTLERLKREDESLTWGEILAALTWLYEREDELEARLMRMAGDE